VTLVTFAPEPTPVEDARMDAVVTAVVIVLVAGVFVGNLYASKRRRRPAVSVYDAVRRRLEAERERNRPAE
jgi:hypothetical protein